MHVRLTINTIRRIHLQRTPSMSKRELNMKKNERWCIKNKILLLCDIVEQCESRRGKCQAIMWKCLCCAEYSDVKLHNWEFKKFFFSVSLERCDKQNFFLFGVNFYIIQILTWMFDIGHCAIIIFIDIMTTSM